MSELVLPGLWLPPRREFVLPKIRLPKWTRPWQTVEDVVTQAVAVDQANLGTNAGSAVTTRTISTSGPVASGGMIAFLIHTFTTAAPTASHSASGGGLTWAVAHTATSGTLRLSLVCAFVPSGLASATTLTASAASSSDMTVGAASWTGIDSSGGTIASAIRAFNAAAATATAWSSGTVGGSAGDGYIGGAGGDGTLQTSTATSGVERLDFNSGASGGSVTIVDKLSSGASDNLAGNWSPGSFNHIGIGVAFKPAAGGGGPTDLPPRRTLLGVGR